MGDRQAVSDGTNVRDVVKYVVARDNEAKEITRALVVHEGQLRQYWPPTPDSSDIDMRWNQTTIEANNFDLLSNQPSISRIDFTNNGLFSFSNDPDISTDVTTGGFWHNIPATRPGQYLVRARYTQFDDSGFAGSDDLNAWLDLWTPRSFGCERTIIGINRCDLMVDIGVDDGSVDQVTNNTFATDNDWIKGTGWTIPGNRASCDGTQVGATDLEQDGGLVATETYEVVFTVSNYSAGNVTPVLGTTAGTARSANGQYIESIVANGVDIKLQGDVNFVGDIDEIYVRLEGSGRPDWTTVVSKRLLFHAYIVGDNDIVWTDVPSITIESLTEGVDALTTLRFWPNGLATFLGYTSGEDSRVWNSDYPDLVAGGSFTVELTVVSGTAPTGGPAPSTPTSLGSMVEWSLETDGPEDLTGEYDLTITDGVNGATGRITMHSQRVDPSFLIWTADPAWVTINDDQDLNGGLDALVWIEVRLDGTVVAGDNTVNPQRTEPWHSDWETSVVDPENYECKLVVFGQSDPTAGDVLDTWITCDQLRRWEQRQLQNTEGKLQGKWQLHIRKKADIGVAKVIETYVEIIDEVGIPV